MSILPIVSAGRENSSERRRSDPNGLIDLYGVPTDRALTGWPANVAAGFHICRGNRGVAISAKVATTFRLNPFLRGSTRRTFFSRTTAGASALGRPLPICDLNELAETDIRPDVDRYAVYMPMVRILQLTLNGRARSDAISENVLLLDYLREFVGLTGTKTGCDGGECGACTVLVDDQPRLSCLTLAATVEGQRVDTIKSLVSDGRLSAVQRGFHEKLGSQCGYCTPGFIMASAGLLRRNPRPSEDEIRDALGSNICRCTGYVKIIEAVKYAADLHAAGASP